MMRFRRRTFRRPHRRSLYQMQPLHLCPFPLAIPAVTGSPPNCDDPITSATELINLAGALPFASQTISKGIIVRGINFQYAYSTIGEQDLGAYGFMEFRSAVVRLPKDPNTGVPAFLPNLFSPSEILVTERVLWRGLDICWTWDNQNNVLTTYGNGDSRLGFGGFSSNLVPGNSSAQPNIRIKTACRCKENESIYFVTCIVHSFVNWAFHYDLSLFGSAAVRQLVT